MSELGFFSINFESVCAKEGCENIPDISCNYLIADDEECDTSMCKEHSTLMGIRNKKGIHFCFKHKIKPSKIKTIEYGYQYRCVLNFRKIWRNEPIRAGLEKLDGDIFILMPLFLQDIEDTYPGEYAMTDKDSDHPDSLYQQSKIRLNWISSGDLYIVEKVTN